MEELRLHLSAAELAPADARRAVGAWLAGKGCPAEVVDDALLVVSELVTNSVTHAGSDSVLVAVLDDHRLRIEVHDRHPDPPVPIDPTSSGGFGLAIIEAVCDAWGWAATDYGKRVWTEILC
jgi:anti-sigma regulatory factor (Ser/Thr protein kinase)